MSKEAIMRSFVNTSNEVFLPKKVPTLALDEVFKIYFDCLLAFFVVND